MGCLAWVLASVLDLSFRGRSLLTMMDVLVLVFCRFLELEVRLRLTVLALGWGVVVRGGDRLCVRGVWCLVSVWGRLTLTRLRCRLCRLCWLRTFQVRLFLRVKLLD